MNTENTSAKVVEMKAAGDAPTAPAQDTTAETEKPRRKRLRYFVMAIVPALLLAMGGWLWFTGGRYVSTDNAYIQQNRVTITPDVDGRIVHVAASDDDHVDAGALLFRIDPEPYRIALEGAEAALASARLQVEQLRTAYAQAKTEEKIAADDVAFKQKIFDRQQGLLAKGVSSQVTFDAADNDLRTAEQTQSRAQQQTQAALAALGDHPDAAIDAHPLVQAALAQRDQARLDLDNTDVIAPADGVVAQADRLQVGQYVSVGTPVLALVENGSSWVEANFKETDLARMVIGDNATIDVDAYPGRTLTGEVASIGAGTGAEFSLLPAQNATGNWVKVVQRVPVRIRFTQPIDDLPMRIGLSAWVRVDTETGAGTAAASEASLANQQ